jgi:hypothetical protein
MLLSIFSGLSCQSSVGCMSCTGFVCQSAFALHIIVQLSSKPHYVEQYNSPAAVEGARRCYKDMRNGLRCDSPRKSYTHTQESGVVLTHLAKRSSSTCHLHHVVTPCREGMDRPWSLTPGLFSTTYC